MTLRLLRAGGRGRLVAGLLAVVLAGVLPAAAVQFLRLNPAGPEPTLTGQRTRLSPTASRPSLRAGTLAATSANRARETPASRQPVPRRPVDPAIPTPARIVRALRSEPPTRRWPDLVQRFGRAQRSHPTLPPTSYALGSRATFWLHNIHDQQYVRLEATLAAMTSEAYFWVENGQVYDPEALERGAQHFSHHVLSTVRRLYGREASPGIDGDPRLHVLHHRDIPGIAGFFSSSDTLPSWADGHSNEREMFYINLAAVDPGSPRYQALLAHELAHMILWSLDPDETTWLNEGLANLAAAVAGYPESVGTAYCDAPDTALLEWEPVGVDNAPHYGASYLFASYLRTRFGDRFLWQLAHEPANGINGIEATLARLGLDISFDDVYLDWLVANAVDDSQWLGGRFGYGGTEGAVRTTDLPSGGIRDVVSPYGADYYDASALVRNGRLKLRFEGDATVGLLEPDEPERLVWWSGRGDNADSRLICPLSAGGRSQREVTFKLWYDLEADWDYGYLRISSDGGQTWQPVPVPGSTDDDPNGNNLGAGLTGRSDGWREMTVDVAQFLGGPAVLQFDVVTDDAVNLTGMAIAKLRLRDRMEQSADAGWSPLATTASRWSARLPFAMPNAGTRDDGEDIDRRCHGEGWQRLPLPLPQRWALQVIIDHSSARRLYRIPVDAEGRATIDLANVPSGSRVWLVVSSLTPGTRQPASYRIRSDDW